MHIYSELEDINSDATKKLYKDRNRGADDYFAQNSPESYASLLDQVQDADVRGLPSIYGKYTFWVQRDSAWQKPKLVVRHKDGPSRAIIELEDTPHSLDYWIPSPSGKKLIYGLSENGDEQTTLHVIDTDTGDNADTPIPFAGFTDQGNIVWVSEKEFIYPRMNGFGHIGPQDKWLLGTKLYQHTIGSDAHTDKLIFGADMPDTVMLIPTLSSDNQTLFVAACEDELTHSIWTVGLYNDTTIMVKASTKSAFQLSSIRGKVYALTNYRAARYRLLACPVDDIVLNFDDWDEILPETDDILREYWVNKSSLVIAHYSRNVASRLAVFDEYGNQNHECALPQNSIIQAINGTPDSSYVGVVVSSFTLPSTHYQLTPINGQLEKTWQRSSLECDDLIDVVQCWSTSADGVKIPYFVVKRRDSTGIRPTILYGYGGFNISLEPSYLSQFRPWVLAGGTYVLMNLRGGSEFGEEWHKQGSMNLKQNTYNDCIAIAEQLILDGMTDADHLGIMGGSNGGLLVAVVTAQRPELFRAGVALVPLTDMMEFYKHQVAEFWVHEYGDPRILEQRAWIEKWDPLITIKNKKQKIENVKSRFPAMYIECALHDARVHPFHSFKLAKAIENSYQDATKGPILLRTWENTGHQGSNLTKHEASLQVSEYFTFLACELSLEIA